MPPPVPPQQPSRGPRWLAPLVLGLALLTGAGLHIWTNSASLVKLPPDTTAAIGPPVAKSRVLDKPAKLRLPPARNTKVAHSEFCRDCESYYLVYDGRGGKIQRSEGYTTRCCGCGSTVAFSDGFYYEIICEGKHITAKMGKRISDAE